MLVRVGLSKFNKGLVSVNSGSNNDFSKDLSTLLPYARSVYGSSRRYACVSGGRSSTKTTMCGADIVVKRALSKRYANSRIICSREFATSLKLTTWNTVDQLIERYDLRGEFTYRKTDKMMIAKKTGSILWFTGLQNVNDIKSMTNISTLWVDEAETLSIDTLEVLAPTVRGDAFNPNKYDTKIIFTFNPMMPIDDVRMFCDKYEDDCDFRHVNIFDLPAKYQNPIMLKDAEADRKGNREYFEWKWLGKPHPKMANQPFANINISNDITFTRSLPAFAFMDPSFKGVDTTALTIMQANVYGGMNVVGFAWKLSWKDSAEIIVAKLREYYVTDFYYENNTIGDIVAFHFNSYYNVSSEGHLNSSNKVNRIYDSAYHVDNLRFLRLPEDEGNFLYMDQLKKYNMKVSTTPKLNDYDDAPDSLASLLVKLRC